MSNTHTLRGPWPNVTTQPVLWREGSELWLVAQPRLWSSERREDCLQVCFALKFSNECQVVTLLDTDSTTRAHVPPEKGFDNVGAIRFDQPQHVQHGLHSGNFRGDDLWQQQHLRAGP